MKHLFQKTKGCIVTHKKTSIFIVIILVVGGYYTYKKVFASAVVPKYITGTVHKGTISQVVTGSGQVSAENQLDITSEVSGKIISVQAKVGQSVRALDLIATLDARDAVVDLQSTQIALNKLTEPAKPGDITNAENNVSKAYSDAFSAMSDVFLHTTSVMSGLKDLLYSRNGYISDQENSTFTSSGRNYRNTAGISYDTASRDYTPMLQDYNTLTKTSSRADIESMISKSYDFAKEISQALKDAQTAVTFISVSQPDYNPSGATTGINNLNSWAGEINADISGLLSAKNSIASSLEILRKLKEGADTLDIQSQQLSLSQKQRIYSKYFIRAPFDGVVGRIPVHVYDQASNGTVIATVVSNQKITSIPLNEVDAVKVKTGQKVALTFDAIAGLKIQGTVAEIDLVGTQSQGVVTYTVKIVFDKSDDRILPGMSIDAAIVTEEKSDTLIVPSSAVKTRGRINYVELAPITSKTLSKQQTVTVGDSDDTNTEILTGLEEGQQIVVRTVTNPGAGTATTPNIFSGLTGGQRVGGRR